MRKVSVSGARQLIIALLLVGVTLRADALQSELTQSEYTLGPGDMVHITVFNNPELTTDSRVSESGAVSFPLVGAVHVVGLTLTQAQDAIARKLGDGNFVSKAQVIIIPTSIVGSQVTVVGHVNRPGRYPLLTTNTHISDALAAAGGIDAIGGDTIVLIQHRSGKESRTLFDLTELFVKGSQQDQIVEPGDTVYVSREPTFYIYGEVEHAGSFRLERHMTLMQGLAVGGFVNEKGSERRTQIFRQDDEGNMHEVELNPTDALKPSDVIFVRSRIF